MRRGILLLLAAVACSEAKPQTAARQGSAAQPDAATSVRAPSPAPRALQQRPTHKLRVRALQGDAGLPLSAALPLSVGDELSAPRELTLRAGDTLELTLDDYAAIRVRGPATFLLLPDGEPALLLRDGLATVYCAPRAARSTASAFWLATPGARLDVVQGARFVVRARGERASELAVVSGQVDVRMPAARPVAVGHGELRCLAENAPPARAPELAQLERAEEWLRSRGACSAKAHAVSAAAPLQAALAALSEQRAEEQALLAEHESLLAQLSPEASALPQKLALLAARGLHELEGARALRASFEAAQLGRSLSAEASSLRERVRALAPYHD